MAFENLTQEELDSMKINPIAQTTAEEVARSYSAAMDSVRLLEAGKPEDMEESEWLDTVKRNVEHLEIQIAKGDYYAGYEMQPFKDAIAL